MKPLFTVHAGEFVFGDYVEKNFKSLKLWIPTKDTGIDFLVTDYATKLTVSIQVKMSRDYRPFMADNEFDSNLTAAGWLVLSHSSLETSSASIWSIILYSHERKSKPVFIIIPPRQLLQKLVFTHGKRKNYHLYPWLFADGRCIEGRGMAKRDKEAFIEKRYDIGARDLSAFYNNWNFLSQIDG